MPIHTKSLMHQNQNRNTQRVYNIVYRMFFVKNMNGQKNLVFLTIHESGVGFQNWVTMQNNKNENLFTTLISVLNEEYQ